MLRIVSLLVIMLSANCSPEPTIAKDYSSYFQKAKNYCIAKNLNQDFFILLDYGAHSGTERFMIYDFRKSEIKARFPVSHGCKNSPWGNTHTKQKAQMSNENNSHASSKGKYLISERGASQWGIGIKYALDGLEESNNNARSRVIVLHGWDQVSSKSVYPEGTPEGWGCPAISNENMRMLDNMLKNRTDKTLLWAID